MYGITDEQLEISIHALHEESDLLRLISPPIPSRFQSTLSMRRATESSRHVEPQRDISIHALHEESDPLPHVSAEWEIFQSTLSMRRATNTWHPISSLSEISIHALHEESDPTFSKTWTGTCIISIHALHEESDSPIDAMSCAVCGFQSTLSMRRATHQQHAVSHGPPYFNPRSP